MLFDCESKTVKQQFPAFAFEKRVASQVHRQIFDSFERAEPCDFLDEVVAEVQILEMAKPDEMLYRALEPTITRILPVVRETEFFELGKHWKVLQSSHVAMHDGQPSQSTIFLQEQLGCGLQLLELYPVDDQLGGV